jgi:hypothetical protein
MSIGTAQTNSDPSHELARPEEKPESRRPDQRTDQPSEAVADKDGKRRHPGRRPLFGS